MLLLCKQCNIILYHCKNTCMSINMNCNRTKIENCIIFNYHCKFCNKIVSILTIKICKECLLKKNIINKENFLFLYKWYYMTNFYICHFCEKKFFPVTCIYKNNYIFKIL